MGEEEQLSAEDQKILDSLMGNVPGTSNEKYTSHSFLYDVAKSKDTTKTGFLKEEEIGVMSNPIRSFKHLALFSKDIMKNDDLYNFFNASSEIETSTSLSREGFLTKLAVVTRKEFSDITKTRKENKSWFKKKDTTPQPPEA